MLFTTNPERSQEPSDVFSTHKIGLALTLNNRILFLFYTYLISLNLYLPLSFSPSPSPFSQYVSPNPSSWGKTKNLTTDGKLSSWTQYTVFQKNYAMKDRK